MKARDLRIENDLELKIVDEKYAGEVFKVVSENFEYLNRWLPWVDENYTARTTADVFRHTLNLINSGNGASYSIFLSGKLIGGIGLNNFDTINKSAEIGYWLAADQQGIGIITKSCRALLDFGFGELDFNRISIRCASGNIKSRAIPERLGFKKEGVVREAEFLHGTFVDLVLYSMLKREWRIGE